jgi:hypothetical protein
MKVLLQLAARFPELVREPEPLPTIVVRYV